MAASPIQERREAFQRYKRDVKERGKPFYPFAMFHDTVMSLVVVGTIIVLAVIWKVTAGEDPNKPGLLGPLYAEPADPGTTNFVPRPDWYFYFLFYLLRIFKWPDTVILGTVGIPTQIQHLKDPPSVTPGSPMPPFASLGQSRLMQLAIFLEDSHGTH